MTYFNQKEISFIISLALQAGETAIKNFKKKDFTISRKIDNSEVTSVDQQISKFLEASLSQQFPNLPIVCEEGKICELSKEIFWLIDPIDGTSSFIKNNDQFTINIALIKNRKPIFGIIYAPLFEGGKLIYTNHASKVIMMSKQKEYELHHPTRNFDFGANKLRIVTSTRTPDEKVINYLNNINLTQYDYQIEKLSSAVKFLRILEQKCELYLHFRPSMEWDTAAGQALIEAFQGEIKAIDNNQDMQPMLYKKPHFANGAFIAYNSSLKFLFN